MISALSSCALRVLTPVWVQGEDARKFLQGQLTQDVRKLELDHALLAAFTTAQGRVQTLVTLVERSEGILMLVPPQWTGGLLERMRRMKLRAQVTFDEHSSWRVGNATASAARELFAALPETPGASVHHEAATLLRWWSPEERYLLLADTTRLALHEPQSDALDLQWRSADVRAGPAVRSTADARVVHSAAAQLGPTRRAQLRQRLLCRPGGRGPRQTCTDAPAHVPLRCALPTP